MEQHISWLTMLGMLIKLLCGMGLRPISWSKPFGFTNPLVLTLASNEAFHSYKKNGKKCISKMY